MREIEKNDWEMNKTANENLIIQNKIQIQMAEEVIKLCERKILEFPTELIATPNNL